MRRSIRPGVDALEDRALLATGAAIHAAQVHAHSVTHVVHPGPHHRFHLTPPVVSAPKTPAVPTPTPIVTSPFPLPSPAAAGDISAILKTDKASYKAGEPVTITLTETNTSNHAVTTTYGPSVDSFSVSKNGATVWGSTIGVMSPMFIELITLQPGESRTFTAVWNDHPSPDPLSTGVTNGAPVTGTLQVDAQFGVKVDPVTITVT